MRNIQIPDIEDFDKVEVKDIQPGFVNLSIPNVPGVYLFMRDGKLAYVGETQSIRSRIVIHTTNGFLKDFPDTKYVYFYVVANRLYRKVIEKCINYFYGTNIWKHKDPFALRSDIREKIRENMIKKL